MKALTVTLILALALTLATTVQATSTASWRLVRADSATDLDGVYSSVTIAATVRYPHGLAVRLYKRGFASVVCARYGLVSSRSYTYGFHVLPVARGAKWCRVTASASGDYWAAASIFAR